MRTTVFAVEDDPVRLSTAFHLVQFIVVQSRGNTPPCQNGSILHPLVSDVMGTLRRMVRRIRPRAPRKGKLLEHQQALCPQPWVWYLYRHAFDVP
ncbi:hypothetical protein KIL84_014592 [Mauremys mutica]|uniref:Uncharacterized protein n=1 Tax=Mauremys mutica TaxID=74926 RepID=A0A9D4B7T7_9SAUR|nr:hypothetical protein KIL84_014592 [Mauremys mutica]